MDPERGFPATHTTTTTTTTTSVVTTLRFDPTYTRSLPGTLKCAQMVLNLIGFICVAVAKYQRWTATNWFSFVAMGGLFITLILFVFFLFHIIEKLYFIPWLLVEWVYCALWTFFYFTAATACASYGGWDSAFAAAASITALDGGDHQQQRSSSTNNVDTLGSSRRTSEAGSDPVTELDDMPEVRNIRSASYMKHKRSTSSLSSLFRRRRWRKRRGSISASFSINDNDIKVELLNVNTATEEELMTLPGVNRTLARNIINHRQAIGGFRKVEDLALVSGMGATKLDFIRPEICISRRKPLSRASSKSPSIESIPSTIESTTVSRSRPMKFINVNTATIFDLMQVSGINQALAARIINYRERKGPFKSVDELKNVGISYKRLGAIRMYFTTEDMDLEKLPARTAVSPVSRSHSHLSTHSHGKLSVKSAYANLENESNDLNGNSSGVTHSSQIQDLRAIYELMSVKTVRPKRTSQFNFTSNCLPAYRVTTWNLECLTPAKIGNPGVLEVITRTILENGFSLLAVQEVCDKKALDKICRELNEPVLPKNREWRGYRGVWKSALHSSTLNYKNETHHLGVLYNSEHIDEVTKVDSEAFSPFQNGNLWQFAVFKVKAKHSTWILINVLSASLESSGSASNGHVQSPSNHKDVMEAINSLVKETDGALIMGYFNAQHAQKGLGNLEDLERIYPSSLKDNKNPGPCSVWITSDLKGFLTGDSGSVQEGLNHIAIPDGWGWNGKATSSGPLWCTLYNVPNTVFNPDLINSTEEKPIEKGNNNNNCESVIKAGPHREIKVDSRS